MNLPSRPTLLALSLFAWLGHVPNAAAIPLLGADSSASSNGEVATPATYVVPEYRNSSSNAGVAYTRPFNYASSYAFSSVTGAYAVASNASGTLSATSAFASILNTVTNTASVAQGFSLTFKIYGGSIGTTSHASLDPDEYLRADYSASIKVNGDKIWFSSASLRNVGDMLGGEKAGVDLNASDDVDDGYYSWGSRYVTVDLGILNPGDSLDVLAELSDSASSNVGVYSYECGGGYDGYGGYGGYGEYGTIAPDTCEQSKGSASAFYGDPLEFEATPTGADPQAFLITARAVPEPGSLALMALAASAAGLARRRKRLD